MSELTVALFALAQRVVEAAAEREVTLRVGATQELLEFEAALAAAHRVLIHCAAVLLRLLLHRRLLLLTGTPQRINTATSYKLLYTTNRLQYHLTQIE